MSRSEPLSIFQEDVEERYNKMYGVSNKRYVDILPDDTLYPVIGQAVNHYYEEMVIGEDTNVDGYLYSVPTSPNIQGLAEYEGEITIFRSSEGEIKWLWKDKNKQPYEWSPDRLNAFYSELKKKLNEAHEEDIYKESTKGIEDLKEDQIIYVNESGEKKIDPFKAFENDKSPQLKTLTTLLRDFIYPYIESTFSNPANIRKFNQLVANFINRNINKLTTSGPVYLVPFTDRDKDEYFKLFNITIKDIKNVMIEYTKTLNGSKFLFLRQNPIYSLLYFTIRYFTIKKDGKSLNSAITIYALSNYPTIYTKYFPKGVIEPVMKYTIDNLTDKFLIKKSKHVFGLLVESAQRSYEFLKEGIEKGNDSEVIRFIQRIHNDQNSMFKKISNIYYENHKKGYAVGTSNTQYDEDTPIIDEVDNATTEVQNAVNKVSLPIIANGVDIVRAEASAKMSQIGVSDCRLFLVNIMTDKNIIPLQKMIEAILFLYIYESKKTIRDVRSQYFLAWSASLFKKTNSKNKNIVTINMILNRWAEESGIYTKYHREASRTNYKKAIFFYVILSIQKYIG